MATAERAAARQRQVRFTDRHVSADAADHDWSHGIFAAGNPALANQPVTWRPPRMAALHGAEMQRKSARSPAEQLRPGRDAGGRQGGRQHFEEDEEDDGFVGPDGDEGDDDGGVDHYHRAAPMPQVSEEVRWFIQLCQQITTAEQLANPLALAELNKAAMRAEATPEGPVIDEVLPKFGWDGRTFRALKPLVFQDLARALRSVLARPDTAADAATPADVDAGPAGGLRRGHNVAAWRRAAERCAGAPRSLGATQHRRQWSDRVTAEVDPDDDYGIFGMDNPARLRRPIDPIQAMLNEFGANEGWWEWFLRYGKKWGCIIIIVAVLNFKRIGRLVQLVGDGPPGTCNNPDGSPEQASCLAQLQQNTEPSGLGALN